MRQMKKWIVAYFKDGEVFGPIWDIESKIKPTRWANLARPGYNLTYKIKEVAEFSDKGYTDSFIKSDEALSPR